MEHKLLEKEMSDITGIDKAALLTELYNNTVVAPAARQFGTAGPNRITKDWLLETLPKHGFGATSVEAYHDYLFGHLIKTDLSKNLVDEGSFDRDNGVGAFQKCVNRVR